MDNSRVPQRFCSFVALVQRDTIGHEAEVASPRDEPKARLGGFTPPRVHVVCHENRTLSWARSPHYTRTVRQPQNKHRRLYHGN